MTEKSEQVLVEDRITTACGVEETGVKIPVS